MNMKIKNVLILLIIFVCTLTFKVDASTCSDSKIMELSSLANNVNVSYEKHDKSFDDANEETYPEFYVTIYNLDENLNVLLTREDTKKSLYVNSNMKYTDGVIYVPTGYATSVKNIMVKIRSNDSNCLNEVLKTVNITLPMYNEFSKYDICSDNPNFAMCQEYSTVDYNDVTIENFVKSAKEYQEQRLEEEKNNSSLFYTISSIFTKYGWYVFGGIILIAGAIVLYYYIRKKNRLV